jgi:DNA-binding beta-propeller fold protein YncE
MNRRRFLAAALATPAALALDPARALGATRGGATVVLATADLESHIVALELATGRVVKRIRTAPSPRSIESSPYGQVVVAHTPIGALTVLDAATLSVRAVIRGLDEPRYTAMHPGEPLAYVTDSGRAEVVTVDLDKARIVHRTRVPGPARHVSVGAGTILWTALGSAAERIAVLDLSVPRRPRLARVFEPPFPAHDVVFAPDGGDHAWVTSGARNALALFRLRGGAPRVFATGAPPQHVAFSGSRLHVACGRDGTVQRRRLDGTPVGTARVPHGSYNVSFGSFPAFARPAVVTPSLNEGTVAVLEPGGAVRFVRRVTRSAHDACVALAG